MDEFQSLAVSHFRFLLKGLEPEDIARRRKDHHRWNRAGQPGSSAITFNRLRRYQIQSGRNARPPADMIDNLRIPAYLSRENGRRRPFRANDLQIFNGKGAS